MSREIKFRVWHKPTNQFVRCHPVWNDKQYKDLGLLSLTSDGQLIFETMYDGFKRLSDSNEVDDFIVQQYTGLKDRNGVEIYEGDYVLFPHKSGGGFSHTEERIDWVQCEVKWKAGGLAAYWGNNDCNIVTFNNKVFIVVGNIFEGVDK